MPDDMKPPPPVTFVFNPTTFPSDILKSEGAGLEGFELKLYAQYKETVDSINKLNESLRELNGQREMAIQMLNKTNGAYEATRALLTAAVADRMNPPSARTSDASPEEKSDESN